MTDFHTVDVLAQLRNQISGTLLVPSDADYEQTRRGWNLSINQFPAMILVVNDVQDVLTAVRFANAYNFGVSVQLTGHGIKYPVDENVLIVTSRLNGVSVDVEARTARVEAGVIWQQVLDVTTPHGLAPLLGTSPHVGVVGYTLGGGIGWLARRYGLAADSVLSIEIVTPDGELRQCSKNENSELFWALLGGGGNFGVVTAMEFALYSVATVYGGVLTYPGTLAHDALHFYREWLKGVPDELTTSFAIFKYPDLAFLPDAIRGKLLVLVRAAYCGKAAEGEQWMRPWLEWQTPVSNSLTELPFSAVASINNDPVAPAPAHPSSDMLNELSDEVIEIMVRYATNPQAPIVYSEVRHAGGAIGRVDAHANAIGNRDASFYLQIGGLAFTPELGKAMEKYIYEYKGELRPYLHGGLFLNFAHSDEALVRVKDAYLPQSYARLVALKAKIDPKNLFRYSYPLVGAQESAAGG